MSEIGEKTCPICAEEMDLTDQQLKPCKCGYEVCVWCWHHIMEMAEKDGKEGRCPVCRTPYDREKIVGVAANCQKLVAEINVKRKQKKPKGPEVKKLHLTDVRVLQRSLVYVIGIPLNLASEDLLKRREYFGQYGKILKVSISRTANGAIQQAPNNSCCVYLSYSKEYEAARCIQSVHSFTLDGRSLRASFGTTKYCHAWLKSVPCNNPDCWYLHDFGSQEDSFTKDELLSAFERSKDHQNIGVTNNLNRHSVKGLPPPTAENSKGERSSATKHPSNITENEVQGSHADGDSRTYIPARAPWVMQVSPSVPPATSSPGSERPLNQNPEKSSDLHPLSSEVVCNESSTQYVRSVISAESCERLLTEQFINKNGQAAISNTTSEGLVERTPFSVTSDKNLCCRSRNNGIGRGIRATSTDLMSNKNIYCSSSNLSDKSIDIQGSSIPELYRTSEPASVLPEMELGKYSAGCETNKPSIHRSLSSDIGESGIISNILTMDLDAPDGSLSPLHNLVKLLGETDKKCSLLKVQSSRKLLDKKQSRFSFAQQEDSCNNNIWNTSEDYSALSDLMDNKESFVDVESNKFLGVPSFTSSKVSEAPCSIPPGFAVPSRAPPPGFSSHLRPRRVDQSFDSSVNHLFQPSCIPNGYSGITRHVEINDPTILDFSEGLLARGSSKRANLSQFNSSEPDARLHMLRQQTISTPQNLGFQDHFRNSYSYLNDAQRITPQQPDQFQPNNPSSFVQPASQHFSDMHLSNSDWVQWNRVNSVTDLGISDLLRNNRMGFNKLIPCYENMQSPTSYFSHLINRSFEL